MIINALNSSSLASAVWTQATRNLTGFGTGAMPLSTAAKTTIAASATVTIQVTAGQSFEGLVCVTAGAAGTIVLQLQDGVNVMVFLSVAAAGVGGTNVHGANNTTNNMSIGIKNNDGANAGSYMYALRQMIQ